MSDETVYVLDPESVRLLTRASVGVGEVLRTDIEETPRTSVLFLDLRTRHPADTDDRQVLAVAMERQQAEAIYRDLGEALADDRW